MLTLQEHDDDDDVTNKQTNKQMCVGKILFTDSFLSLPRPWPGCRHTIVQTTAQHV
jgi:hypothetical protein